MFGLVFVGLVWFFFVWFFGRFGFFKGIFILVLDSLFGFGMFLGFF